MTKMECFVAEQIKKLIPNYESIDLNATVTLSSFSVEFFATINGVKMQCFEMIDKGLFTEKEFNSISRNIANYCRALPEFNKSGLNKYRLTFH